MFVESCLFVFMLDLIYMIGFGVGLSAVHMDSYKFVPLKAAIASSALFGQKDCNSLFPQYKKAFVVLHIYS